MPSFIPLVGKKFGRLTVIKRRKIKGSRRTHWFCSCRCGKSVVSTSDNLTSGNTRSCGCIRNETPNRLTHGQRSTRFYSIYCGIKKRCENRAAVAFKNYGGRGIKIDWATFEEFDKAMRRSYERHVSRFGERDTTIERVNNEGHYSKKNCRWATRKEQALNTRSNVFLTFKGKTQTMKEWAEECGVKYDKLKRRIKNGWSINRALTQI